MSIKKLHVVLCMIDTLSMKRNSVNCVRLIHLSLSISNYLPKRTHNWVVVFQSCVGVAYDKRGEYRRCQINPKLEKSAAFESWKKNTE